METKKKVPVYKIPIMLKLVRMGFDVISVHDNEVNPKFKVFFFENTPELDRALRSITK